MPTNAEFVFDARNIVGESLVWDDRAARLVWVDIVGRCIHGLDPETGAHESWQMPDLATSIGLRKDGGAIVGLRKEIALWDFGGRPKSLAIIEPELSGNRLNEGVVAPDGSFWVGTMANNIGPDDEPVDIPGDAGRLWRIDANGQVDLLSDDRFGITNTCVWLGNGRFVTADTMRNELYSYRWNAERLCLDDRRMFFADFPRGFPDGSCIDAEGYVWNCRVAGGSCLARIAPDGSLDRIVELPCSWPTSCAFGGKDRDTLFVTSARFTMTAAHLGGNPHEGALFAVKPGVRGMPANRFG
jgi:sugar lactone lactonase YvrE